MPPLLNVLIQLKAVKTAGACPLPDCEFVYLNFADVARSISQKRAFRSQDWRAEGESPIRGYSRSPRWRNGAWCLSS